MHLFDQKYSKGQWYCEIYTIKIVFNIVIKTVF